MEYFASPWPPRLLIGIVLGMLLAGCGRAIVPDTAYVVAPMPQLEPLPPSPRPHPVFGLRQEFTASPVAEIGYETLSSARAPETTRIAVLGNGDASLAARLQTLRQAKTSIRIQALIFAGDESGLRIAEMLKQKKAEGLDVQVIVDAISNLGWQTQWMYFDLKQNGIEVQGYEALYLEWLNEIPISGLTDDRDSEAPNSRYHEKLWIVDGETPDGVAVVGGLNIANEYFRINPDDPQDYWRDQDIIVRGNLVSDMVAAFERNFRHFLAIKKSRGVLNTDLYWETTRRVLGVTVRPPVWFQTNPRMVARVRHLEQSEPPIRYENARSRFFHNRPRLGETYIRQAYTKLIENSKQEILICNAYFIPSQDFIERIGAAVGRGVRVMIVSNSPATNDLPELTMVGRGYYKTILAFNDTEKARKSGGRVEIWEWRGQRYDSDEQTEGTLHAKYAVFDRRLSLVGSYNLDPRSENLNSETAVVFENAGLSTELARMFYENDLAFSRRVTRAAAETFNDPADALYRLKKDFGSLFEAML